MTIPGWTSRKTHVVLYSSAHSIIRNHLEHSASVPFPLHVLIPFVSPNDCEEVNKSHCVLLIR